MAFDAFAVITTLLLATTVAAEYNCLCNYEVEEPVMSAPNANAEVIGYLYEFDCKATAPYSDIEGKYIAIQFEKKVGYVVNAVQQVCNGDPPKDDLVVQTTSELVMTSPVTPLVMDSTSMVAPVSSGNPMSTTTDAPPMTSTTDAVMEPVTSVMEPVTSDSPVSTTTDATPVTSVMEPVTSDSPVSTTTDAPPMTSTTDANQVTSVMEPVTSDSPMSTSPVVTAVVTEVPIVSSTMDTTILFTMDSTSVTESVTSAGMCHTGFTQCTDGRCEPYPDLCGETGYITTKSPPSTTPSSTVTMKTTPMTEATSTLPPLSSSATVGHSSVKPVSVVTVQPGACLPGWEKCEDGTCEPFHFLCTEHDGSSETIIPPPVITSPVSPAVTVEASVAPGITSPVSPAVTVGASVVPPVSMEISTSSMMPSTTPAHCPVGWEYCSDGICEPFHWLCTEHSGINVVG